MLLADGRTVPLTAAAKKKIMAEVDTMAASALRCLAFAQKTEIPAFAGYDGAQSHPVGIASEGPRRLTSTCTASSCHASRSLALCAVTGPAKLTGSAACDIFCSARLQPVSAAKYIVCSIYRVPSN